MNEKKELTGNEIGYLVYKWVRKGYNFCPVKYDPNHDFTNYLFYYTNSERNKRLRDFVVNEFHK